MRQALQQADIAQTQGEVPIGAVLTHGDTLLAAAHNSPLANHDPAAHAEMVVLRRGGQRLANYRLPNTTLYVTLEPCAMCFAAMVHARIARLVFGASDPKQGALGGGVDLRALRIFNHRFAVSGGVLAEPCAARLVEFFRQRR